jgi:D-alanine-D-alanine ligase
MNIIILVGGFSSEREVSLNSGINAVVNLAQSHTVTVIDIVDQNNARLYSQKIIELCSQLPKHFIIETELQKELDLVNCTQINWQDYLQSNKPDFVFIALHGEFGEDGKLQKILENLELPFNGSSSLVSQLCMDKWQTYQHISKSVQVPKSQLLTAQKLKSISEKEYTKLQTNLGRVLFAKPNTGGSSVGNKLIKSFEDLKELQECDYIIQECLVGREVTCTVLHSTPLPVIEIVSNNNFDYHDKYLSTTTSEICPALLPVSASSTIQTLSLEISTQLGCKGLTRSDFILINDIPYFLEINTLPGLTYSSLAPKAAQESKIMLSELFSKLLLDYSPIL